MDIRPGWYRTPDGLDQYWDGEQWAAPAAPAAAPPRLIDWFGALVATLLFPPLGLVAGVLWLVEGGGKTTIGVVTTVLSGLWLLGWLSTLGGF